jgi:hypothetical protein
VTIGGRVDHERPWLSAIVFLVIAVGATTAIAVFMASRGWTVSSPGWAGLVPIAMWAPAFGRFVARRIVDRAFTSTLSLRRWGATGARVILRPLAFPLVVYGAAYAIAWGAGLAHWNPGGGKWTSGSQIAANLVINLALLGVFGTFTAMGEEIGWRGYLQPRLDAAGVRSSLILVWLAQLAYHAPLMLGAGYINVGSLVTTLALFAASDLPVTFIMAREAYMARSLWPAVFFHSFHNTISQWLFPKLFTVAAGQFWIDGEGGLLPTVGYVLMGAAMYWGLRRRGESWLAFARQSLRASTEVAPVEAGR